MTHVLRGSDGRRFSDHVDMANLRRCSRALGGYAHFNSCAPSSTSPRCMIWFCWLISARFLHICRHCYLCARSSTNGDGLRLKLDGASSRFCDAGALLTSVLSLMAADSITDAVWVENMDNEVYAECQHFNSKMRASRREAVKDADPATKRPPSTGNTAVEM